MCDTFLPLGRQFKPHTTHSELVWGKILTLPSKIFWRRANQEQNTRQISNHLTVHFNLKKDLITREYSRFVLHERCSEKRKRKKQKGIREGVLYCIHHLLSPLLIVTMKKKESGQDNNNWEKFFRQGQMRNSSVSTCANADNNCVIIQMMAYYIIPRHCAHCTDGRHFQCSRRVSPLYSLAIKHFN